MQCVTQTSKGFYFPRAIPRPRGNSHLTAQFLIGTVLLVASLLNTKKMTSESVAKFIVAYLCTFCNTFTILEIVKRCCLYLEEQKHIKSRYEEDHLHLFRNVFSLSLHTLIPLMFSLVGTTYMTLKYTNPWRLLYNNGSTSLLLSALSMLLFLPLLRLDCAPIYDSLWIEKANGLNYGAGMASSFYHGYLKLVLPKTGTKDTDLFEQIQDYIDKEGVRFAEYKLFILIPQSTYCHVSLKNPSSPSIDECSSLEEKIKTVAGVQRRVYKNSVYRISDKKGSKIYVCAEYATPLKTFNDVMNCQGQFSAYYKQQKNEIVLQFYLTLKKILEENDESKNLCELIYYNDKDNQGEYYDVGEIILQRLVHLKKKNKKEA